MKYDIIRYSLNKEWIHVCYAGKTKAKALEKLEKISKYKHFEGVTFRIVQSTEPEVDLF